MNEAPSTGIDAGPVLDGSWERAGRSPNAAAVLALLAIGAIYFNGQSLLALIGIFLSGAFRTLSDESAGIVEKLMSYAEVSKNPIRLAVVISQFLLMLFPTLWLVRRWHTSNVREYIRLRACPPVYIVLAAAAVLFLYPANSAMQQFLVGRLHVPEFVIELNQKLIAASTPGEFLWVVLAVAVTPAICEETLFRGYVQRTFERTIGWKSILLTGVIFGLYHMQPLGLFSLSIFGFLIGYLYFRSRSILPAMAAHFTNNFIAVAMLFLQRRGAVWHDGTSLHIPLATALLLLVPETLVLVVFHRMSGQRSP